MSKNTEITRLTPHGQMEILSQLEVGQLKQDSEHDSSYDIYRRCSLAVLNVGSVVDDSKQVLEQYKDFNIRVVSRERGIKLEFENAPSSAYVDGQVITGIQEQLFSVLRDIVYIKNQIETNQIFDRFDFTGFTAGGTLVGKNTASSLGLVQVSGEDAGDGTGPPLEVNTIAVMLSTTYFFSNGSSEAVMENGGEVILEQ